MATAKQLAALKKARAARKKNLKNAPAKKTTAKKKAKATPKQLAALKKARAARKKATVKKAPVRKATRAKSVKTEFIVTGKLKGKTFYLLNFAKSLFDDDKTKAKKFSGKTAAGYVLKLTNKFKNASFVAVNVGK